MSVKISVIVPTYKPEEYLYCCLDSLMSQSLDKSLYEILLILNGCGDPYPSLIKTYLNKEDGGGLVRFFHSPVAGVSNARNMGLDVAKGEYITFVDDDDFVSPTYLEELLGKASQDTVAISNELRYNEKEDTNIEESWSLEYNRKAPYGKQHYSGMRKFFSGPWMKLIHRDTIASYRFDTRFTNGEDSLFMFAISANMKYVDFTSADAIYYRRVRAGSAMSKERKAKAMIRNRFRMIGEFMRIYRKNPKAYNLRFLMTRIMGCLHSIMISLKPSKLFAK
jgi:glycosyltransferase involved in cell wall biosynthesis